MEFVLPLIGLAIMAPFVILAVKYSDKETEDSNAAWSGVSNKLGFDLEKPRRMTGSLHGIQMTLEQVSEVLGGEPRTQTRVTARMPSDRLPSGLLLTREDFVTRTETKLKRGQDIELGIEGIDENVIVQAADEEEVRAWASRGNVAKGIAGVVSVSWLFRVDQNHVSVILTRPENDPERLEHMVRTVAASVLALCELD